MKSTKSLSKHVHDDVEEFMLVGHRRLSYIIFLVRYRSEAYKVWMWLHCNINDDFIGVLFERVK